MSTTLTFNEERKLAELRLNHKRKIEAGRRKTTQRVGSPLQAPHKYNLFLDVLGAVLSVIAGISVLFFTGILSVASSTVVQIILIAVIVYAYLVIFRSAFYS